MLACDTKNMSTVLLVDDDQFERHLLIKLLQKKFDFTMFEASSGKEALDILVEDQARKIKAVVMDLNMPVMGGMEALTFIKERFPWMPVIILTGSTDKIDIQKALQLGASDFISKPYDSDRILLSIMNAIKMSVLSKELSSIKKAQDGKFIFENIIGHDSGLSKEIKIARKASVSDIPVLISGETGTGKELFARAIHGEGHRAGKPFITVNCGAIPSQLVESTLFGHEKGSFTGATQKFIGKFREAQGGTIFLDEIGELPQEAQVKLLRVLQQKEVEPVGASKPIPVNVRVISATNRNLDLEVKAGRFREDLLFRLNVLDIEIPPLRNRKQDIDELLDYFLERFCGENNMMTKKMDMKARNFLIDFSWPGNIRQLENVIHRAVTVSDSSTLCVQDFDGLFDLKTEPRTKSTTENKISIECLKENGIFKTMDEIEKEAMQKVLNVCDFNITRAAKMLGMAKSTFYKKLK